MINVSTYYNAKMYENDKCICSDFRVRSLSLTLSGLSGSACSVYLNLSSRHRGSLWPMAERGCGVPSAAQVPGTPASRRGLYKPPT